MSSGESLKQKKMSSGLIKAEHVFKEFARYYQDRWTQKLVDKVAAAKDWAAVLDEFTLDTIKDVINDIRSGRNKFCSFVPLAGEFAQLCREKKSPYKLFLDPDELEKLKHEYFALVNKCDEMRKKHEAEGSLSSWYFEVKPLRARMGFIEGQFELAGIRIQ
jgi:hypothetical protein